MNLYHQTISDVARTRPSTPARESTTTDVGPPPARIQTAPQTRQPGLCSQCSHATHCTFPRDPQRPVHNCDEFAGIIEWTPPAPSVQPAPAVVSLSTVTPTSENATVLKGLCKTCSRQYNCTFPKPDGGVWHCEEFA